MDWRLEDPNDRRGCRRSQKMEGRRCRRRNSRAEPNSGRTSADIRAKEDLYALLSELCLAGASVILYSSEDAELLANADRILVFNSGRVVNELKGEQMNEFNLYSAALATAHT